MQGSFWELGPVVLRKLYTHEAKLLVPYELH